ncbi:sialic acid-binding Ig-like lectin 14 [Gadus chalcogrammus]|uniref:sialic acid-binding Ig-like lectin 14 n=1 Tax=Gadus chalcogrammus TaxID=1042646 RepID=UPI0024C4CAEC|nr:sialic acid-binding Ig-like lectin 14 [Gadus chalcogrammus]
MDTNTMHPLALLGIICLCLRATGGHSSSWTADIPSSITALIGSCVVIPCSFDYPHFVPKPSTQFVGVWFDQNDSIIYHPVSSRMVESYRGRVSYLGDINGKNCTVMIDPVKESDKGSYYFRIEISDFNKYSYSEKKVSVTVKSAPEPITFEVDQDLKEGESVMASCSVTHTCPTAPPTFTWTHSALLSSELLPQKDGQWQSRSGLSFRLTRDLHNKSLTCRVKFRGGQRSNSSTVLLVKHTPLNVTVQQPWAVPEGGATKLRCLSDGYPPPSRYWWTSEGEELLHVGPHYLWPNVSRHSGRLYCSVRHTLGSIQSGLFQLNVTYPPEVTAASACSTSALRVSCECVVEANPPAAVQLSRPVGVPLSTGSETQGSVTVATLAGDEAALWSSDPIYCHAFNSLGNTTHTLQVPPNGIVLTITGIATCVLLLLVMVPLGIKWKRKQIENNTTFADAHINMSTRWNKENLYKNDDAVYANM